MSLDRSLNTTILILDTWSERLENAKLVKILWLDIFACKKQSLI